jgi:hypothetical protein
MKDRLLSLLVTATIYLVHTVLTLCATCIVGSPVGISLVKSNDFGSQKVVSWCNRRRKSERDFSFVLNEGLDSPDTVFKTGLIELSPDSSSTVGFCVGNVHSDGSFMG